MCNFCFDSWCSDCSFVSFNTRRTTSTSSSISRTSTTTLSTTGSQQKIAGSDGGFVWLCGSRAPYYFSIISIISIISVLLVRVVGYPFDFVCAFCTESKWINMRFESLWRALVELSCACDCLGDSEGLQQQQVVPQLCFRIHLFLVWSREPEGILGKFRDPNESRPRNTKPVSLKKSWSCRVSYGFPYSDIKKVFKRVLPSDSFS